MNIYKHTISPEQLDFCGLATVPSLYKLIIESIGQNIRKEGFGIDVMAGRGLTWALARCAMEVTARPALYDDIFVNVWRGSSQGLCYDRRIIATNSAGDEICRGSTHWCVLDKSSRRPQPIMFTSDKDRGPECDGPRHLRPFTSLTKLIREVGYSECDFNGHLNNSRYLEMFYDMIPRKAIDSMNKFRLDINFRREVPCGSMTESYITENRSSGYDFCMYFDGSPACCASISPML